MREDSRVKANNLHFHDGSTCHGFPSLQECLVDAIAKGWPGKVLQKDDVYKDGTKATCFSLISGAFDHWAKHGTFVAVVELTARIL